MRYIPAQDNVNNAIYGIWDLKNLGLSNLYMFSSGLLILTVFMYSAYILVYASLYFYTIARNTS